MMVSVRVEKDLVAVNVMNARQTIGAIQTLNVSVRFVKLFGMLIISYTFY